MGNVLEDLVDGEADERDATAARVDGVGVGGDGDLGALLDLTGVALRDAGLDLDAARADEPDDRLAGAGELARFLDPGLDDAREGGDDARGRELALSARDAGLCGVGLGARGGDTFAGGAELTLCLRDPGIGLGNLGASLGKLRLDVAELEGGQDRVAVERKLAAVLVLCQVERRLGGLALRAGGADPRLGTSDGRLRLGNTGSALCHAGLSLAHAGSLRRAHEPARRSDRAARTSRRERRRSAFRARPATTSRRCQRRRCPSVRWCPRSTSAWRRRPRREWRCRAGPQPRRCQRPRRRRRRTGRGRR